MEEEDILQRLLSVESQGSELVKNAEAEAERRVQQANLEVQKDLSAYLQKRIGELQRQGEEVRARLEKERLASAHAYEEELKNKPLNQQALFARLWELIERL